MAEWDSVGELHPNGRGYMYVKRGENPPERIAAIEHEVTFGSGRHSTLFCTRDKVDVYRKDSVPCGNVNGVRGCMDCPYAYIQILSVNSHLKEAEKKLTEMGVHTKPIEPEKPSRFENIM
jgi:hypothetical protein